VIESPESPDQVEAHADGASEVVLHDGPKSNPLALAVLIVGALISVNLGHESVGADPARYIATMHLAFWVLAAVTAVALAISVSRIRR